MGFSRYDHQTDVQDELENAIAIVKSLIPTLERTGIKLAIENHCDATSEELLSIIRRINHPQVGVCADLGNFMINLEDPVMAVHRLAPYIQCLTLEIVSEARETEAETLAYEDDNVLRSKAYARKLLLAEN